MVIVPMEELRKWNLLLLHFSFTTKSLTYICNHLHKNTRNLSCCRQTSTWEPSATSSFEFAKVLEEVGYGYDDVEKRNFLMAYPGVRIPIDVKLYLKLGLSARHPPVWAKQPSLFPRKYSSSWLQSPFLNYNKGSIALK